MSETKFTKGPWVVIGEFDNENYAEVTTQAGFEILSVSSTQIDVEWEKKGDDHWCQEGFHVEIPHSEANANAHLIAAAPEMYSLLERLEKECEMFYSEFGEPSNGEYEAAFVEIKSLLAKARGESC